MANQVSRGGVRVRTGVGVNQAYKVRRVDVFMVVVHFSLCFGSGGRDFKEYNLGVRYRELVTRHQLGSRDQSPWSRLDVLCIGKVTF